MRYDEFRAQFDEAHESWGFGRIDTAAAEAEIERLRGLVPQLESAEDRSDAEFVLDDFADEISPASQDRMGRASAALKEGLRSDGSIDEQIDRARQSMRDITRISKETDNESESFAIIRMNSSLATRVSELRDEAESR